MVVDIMTNRRFEAIIKELFIRCRKLNISLVFITQSYCCTRCIILPQSSQQDGCTLRASEIYLCLYLQIVQERSSSFHYTSARMYLSFLKLVLSSGSMPMAACFQGDWYRRVPAIGSFSLGPISTPLPHCWHFGSRRKQPQRLDEIKISVALLGLGIGPCPNQLRKEPQDLS